MFRHLNVRYYVNGDSLSEQAECGAYVATLSSFRANQTSLT